MKIGLVPTLCGRLGLFVWARFMLYAVCTAFAILRWRTRACWSCDCGRRGRPGCETLEERHRDKKLIAKVKKTLVGKSTEPKIQRERLSRQPAIESQSPLLQCIWSPATSNPSESFELSLVVVHIYLAPDQVQLRDEESRTTLDPCQH